MSTTVAAGSGSITSTKNLSLLNNEVTIAGNLTAMSRVASAGRGSVAVQAQALGNQTGGNIMGFTYE